MRSRGLHFPIRRTLRKDAVKKGEKLLTIIIKDDNIIIYDNITTTENDKRTTRMIQAANRTKCPDTMKTIMILSLRCLLFVFSFLSLAIVFDQSLAEIGKWWSVVCSVGNLLTLIALYRLNKAEHLTYRQMMRYPKKATGWKAIALGIVVVVVLGMAGMFLAGYLTYGVFPYLAKDLIAPIPIWLAWTNVLILPLSTTLAEDGLYLGIGVNRLTDKRAGVLVPAFFYALQHSFIPLYFDLSYMLYRFLSFLPLTILLCLWYQKKHNPVPIMVGHFVINLATAVQILIMSSRPELYATMAIFL